MSTRSEIGILRDDGSVSAIYHHWDGYLEGVGAMLLEEYNSKELAEEGLVNGFNEGKENIWDCSAISVESWVDSNLHSDREYLYLFKKDNWYYCEINYTENWEERMNEHKAYKYATKWELVSKGLGFNDNVMETE